MKMALNSIISAIISSANSCVLPFLTIFLRYLGLSAVQCGLVRSIQSTVLALSIPFWNSLLVGTNKRKSYVLFAILFSTAVYLSLTFLPSSRGRHFAKHHCFEVKEIRNDNLTDQDILGFSNELETIRHLGENITELGNKTDEDQSVTSQETGLISSFDDDVIGKIRRDLKRPHNIYGLFFVVLLLLISGSFVIYPIKCLIRVDNPNLNKPNDLIDFQNRKLYRKCCSSLSVIVTGCFVVLTPCHIFFETNHFVIHFYSYAILMAILAFAVVEYYQEPTNSTSNEEPTEIENSNAFEMYPVKILTVIVFFSAYWNAIFFDYRLWAVEDSGGGELTFTIVVAIGLQSQILASYFFHFLKKKKFGLIMAILIANSFYTLSMLFTSVASIWTFAPIQCLYGMAYDLIGTTLLFHDKKPTYFLKTYVVLLASAVSTMVNSFIVEYSDVKTMFRINFYLSSLMLITVVMYSFYFVKQRGKANLYAILTSDSSTTEMSILPETQSVDTIDHMDL